MNTARAPSACAAPSAISEPDRVPKGVPVTTVMASPGPDPGRLSRAASSSVQDAQSPDPGSGAAASRNSGR